MDDNVWEYPFGDLDDDDDGFFQEPVIMSLPDDSVRQLAPYFTIDA